MKQPRSRLVALAVALVAAGCADHSGTLISPLTTGLKLPVFETRLEIATGSSTHADYRMADFNGDGILDMAVISLTGELRVLLGNKTGFNVVEERQIDGLPIWMAGGDFDNDGDEDLVIVRSDADSTDLWINDGTGQFAQAGSLMVGADALAVAVGDLNGDGNLDVAVSRPLAPQIVVGLGDGAGAFPGMQTLALPGGGTAFNLAIADADRDEVNDLIVADTGFSRLVVFPAASQLDAYQLLVPGTPGAVAIGDLSGDGAPDLVVSAFTADRYVVITDVFPTGIGEKDGGIEFPTGDYLSFDIPVPARPSLAVVGDVTGDGRNDLVACLAFSATMCIAPGVEGGGVGEQFLLDSSGLPLRPFLGDFDQNGANDVFALSGNGNRVNLWLARAAGTLIGARNYATGLPGSSWVESADFDGDGIVEVVTGSSAASELAFLGPDGQGGLGVVLTLDVGRPIYQLGAGDLDLDGKVDLVIGVPAETGVEGGIKMLRNLSTPGNLAFEVLPGSAAALGTGSFPFGITTSDLDRDGDIDIAVCDFVGGTVHIVPGTAQPFVFAPEVVIAVGGGPVDVAAADFTGDGLKDLAVSRANQSDIVILRNLGNGMFAEFLAVPVGASPNYLVTADFNRDGRADLVVSNAASGSITVLFGQGGGFSGQSFAAGLAPTALLARDLNGDGTEDILVASLQSGDFRVMVGDGRGSFPLLPSFPGTAGASDAIVDDLNGDGLADLVISSLTTDRLSLVVKAPEAEVQQQLP